MIRLLSIAAFTLVLSGCQFIDTYYTYKPSYLEEIEKDFGTAADPESRRAIKAVFEATQIRVSISRGQRNTLVVHRSYRTTNDLKAALKDRFNTATDIQKYPDCDYFDDKNWICENFFAHKYELRNGELFISGRQLKKNYTLRF